jgi:hypothetical protein
MPGLNRLNYDGDYWPCGIDSVLDDDILNWLKKYIWLAPLYLRRNDFDVLSDTRVSKKDAEKLKRCGNRMLEHHSGKEFDAVRGRGKK